MALLIIINRLLPYEVAQLDDDFTVICDSSHPAFATHLGHEIVLHKAHHRPLEHVTRVAQAVMAVVAALPTVRFLANSSLHTSFIWGRLNLPAATSSLSALFYRRGMLSV